MTTWWARLRSPLIADGALAALLIATLVPIMSQFDPEDGDRGLDWLGYALIVLAAGVLAARRVAPLAVVAAVTVALCVYAGRDYVGGPVYLTDLVALYSLAATGNRRFAYTTALASSGALVLVGMTIGNSDAVFHPLFAGWAAASVFLGDAVQTRRRHVSGLVERARFLEQSREDEVRRRLVEERLRIARDLHDSIAHAMATITVQAGAGAHVIDRHPDQAAGALRTIQQTSAEVLDELAAFLGVLRLDGSDEADLLPTPGIERLGELATSSGRAGLRVDLKLDDGLDEVTKAVGVAVYRIVQESLTNVMRHAAAARARVTVERPAPGGLVVEVVDNGNGSGSAASGSGMGIRGMRERAESTGGSLEAGPVSGGGFRVRATWARA